MPSLTFTGSQHRLRLPDEIRNRAAPWIQTQATTAYRSADQAPFRRMIDFWFTSIAWAVHNGISPVDHATGGHFVSLGPNPNDVRYLEDWRADLLVILAVRDFGVESSDIADTRKVIDLANRYSESGAPLLLDKLEESSDLALPRLYLVAEIFSDLVAQAAIRLSERTF